MGVREQLGEAGKSARIAPSFTESVTMNEASAWRLEIAERMATVYEKLDGVCAAMVVGSTARGHSDRYSDLDVFVFWERPPTDEQRQSPLGAFERADMVKLFDFDAEWMCWSDMFNLGRNQTDDEHSGLATDVTHYLKRDAESLLNAVNTEQSTQESAHNLAAHVVRGKALCGEDLVEGWQSSLVYSDALATTMVMRYGQVDYFWRWKGALDRGNDKMLAYQNLLGHAQRLLRTLLAVNRTFSYGFGWLDPLLEEIKIGPEDFTCRFRALCDRDVPDFASELTALFEETFDVIEKSLPDADVSRLRRLFRYERALWDHRPQRI